jgi:hypothetical protein
MSVTLTLGNMLPQEFQGGGGGHNYIVKLCITILQLEMQVRQFL